MVPFAHAKKLYDSLPGAARRMWTMQGAGHNDWPAHVSSTWWKEIMDFLSPGFVEETKARLGIKGMGEESKSKKLIDLY